MSAQPKHDIESTTVPESYTRRSLPQLAHAPLMLDPVAIEHLKQDQIAFSESFPPIRSGDNHHLILVWEEIERQFLDLCATWEQTQIQTRLALLKAESRYQSPERTLRELWVIAHCSSDLDTPPPRLGTGRFYPMP